MKQYAIFENNHGQRDAVKQGWSWPAFLFGPFWALYCGFWGLGLGFLALTVCLTALQAGLQHAVGTDASSLVSIALFFNMIAISLAVLFGVKGNEWREAKLIRNGYAHLGKVDAINDANAIVASVNG